MVTSVIVSEAVDLEATLHTTSPGVQRSHGSLGLTLTQRVANPSEPEPDVK